MDKRTSISILLLRVSMGFLMLYAGLSKVVNPEWSSAFYLKNAKTFSSFYTYLLNSGFLNEINFATKWGMLLIGISLIIGIGVRIASFFGIILMMLLYFPILRFPYAGEHAFIVDEHIIYSFVFLFFIFVKAGEYYGLINILQSKANLNKNLLSLLQ
jgi:thiosulfate dehydrogenase (quinone) large subunit